MADVIKKATNKFTKGLVLDFSPENTRNEVLTHALNATLLTFNGNELSLLNDMGNARVETAYLPEGYIPVGTCEYGGIIYIVSYNPLEDKSQIGCFPSPERNVSSDELGRSNVVISNSDFQEENGDIKNTSKYVLLKDDNLNPGDKFLICSTDEIYEEKLADLYLKNANGYEPIANPLLKLSVVSIDDSGKITYLDSALRLYEVNKNSKLYKYHILGEMDDPSNQKVDIDSYRNTLSSGYSVFKSKTSGKLAILAELIMIDSYSVTHSLRPRLGSNNMFDIIIHTEVSPEITQSNINTAPKLKYYYLKDSQGELTTYNSTTESVNIINLFDDNGETTTFVSTKLNTIFETNHLDDSNKNLFDKTIELAGGVFNFPNKNSYYKHSSNEFLVSATSNYSYEDVTIGSIKIPHVIFDNNLEFPFKYNYTLVPCMEYGKLDHLSVSNTIDFSKLRSFEKSDFTTWKYRIDGDQLRLTLGAEIHDTFINDKVDGLFLEFYDLWGFAGSLEITGKDSYNGVFTKIISLNTLQALNKNRIIDNKFKSGYKRNVNIAPAGNQFKYKDTIVTWNNETGWEGILEEDNDCGVLYSNLIYGVKTYIRQTTSTGLVFTPKSLFFLYTLPILNDYYYNTDNFNNISNPTVLFVLTHKIEDAGTINKYHNPSCGITDGYLSADYPNVQKYQSGLFEGYALNTVAYFQYAGTSKLFLEIGLKEDYKNYNLSFSKDLNNLFSCELLLTNDSDDNTYDIKTDLTYHDVLHYKDTTLSLNINTLGFDDYDATKTINTHEFGKLLFINVDSGDTLYIPINYNFVVGHPFSITEIKREPTSVNTICALLHKDEHGEYNLHDFGIHNIGHPTEPVYTSSAVVSNCGVYNHAYINIHKLIQVEGNYALLAVQICGYEINAQLNMLNDEKPKEWIMDKVGKLAFCLPLAHNNDDNNHNGVNIYGTFPDYYLGTSAGTKYNGDDSDDCLGCIPLNNWYNNPVYNMSVNTTGYAYISAIDYLLISGTIPLVDINDTINNTFYATGITTRMFNGLSAQQLTKFYKKLIKTMAGVYAYNPDYNTLNMNKGSIKTENKPLSFTSNLLATNASFNLNTNTLNEYLYIGYVTISEYLEYLHTYSGNSEEEKIKVYERNELSQKLYKALVNISPDYTYCGKDNLLLQQLIYSVPNPSVNLHLVTEGFKPTVIKHSDGLLLIIEGEYNKYSLYGFDSELGNLIELDVSNYEIKNDGTLKLINILDILDTNTIINISNKTNNYFTWELTYLYRVLKEYDKCRIKGTSLTINDLIYTPSVEGHRLYVNEKRYKYETDLNSWKKDAGSFYPPYRPVVFYRSMSDRESWSMAVRDDKGVDRASYNYSGYNRLALYTGPCFTAGNLN